MNKLRILGFIFLKIVISGRKMIHILEDFVHLEQCVIIIRKSFQTVAEEYGFTPETVPSHPSFITKEKFFEWYQNKKITMFGYFEEGELSGCIGIEKSSENVYYFERLAVLPNYRHRKIGRKLMQFAEQYIYSQSGTKISIAIIDKQDILKKWYHSYGFREIRKHDFPQLPFTVCFMEKDVESYE